MIMARRHGWELPLHTFQVVAITVFFLLSVAYYAFFAPFLGRDIYEYVAFGVYSVLDFFVFILYVRCTAIDPSDPGILIDADKTSRGILIDADKTSRHTSQFNGELPEPNKIGLQVEGMSGRHYSNRCPKLGCFFCGFLVREDCCSNEDILQQQSGDEGTPFCTLCNAEVHDS